MRILGIDPGSVFCGWGVIDSVGKSLSIVEYGTIELKKKHEDITFRMKEIYDRIYSVILRTSPDFAAIETAFYSKNVQSLIKLTMARSAAMLAVLNQGLAINEYSAREIKRSVAGRGNASKEQVSFMMKALLNITENPKYYDTTDALAIAVCHSNFLASASNVAHNNKHLPAKSTSKKRAWEEYLQNNPDKIVQL